jgi:hypothetical protein
LPKGKNNNNSPKKNNSTAQIPSDEIKKDPRTGELVYPDGTREIT